ncbi:MAG: hypothetical protein FJ295_06945 [Planctomycetes bacterium]|nr:hypothetical protein [Planctomycetota bacterium]
MSRIAHLRQQLHTLLETRRWIRRGAAYASLALAVCWALGMLFAVDLLFHLSRLQRLFVIAGAAAAVVVACRRFTRPLLRVQEDETDMALFVEREHQIESDLVAALQFESPQASRWGSVQLETAVIDYVAELGTGLDVFQGFSREALTRRGILLGFTLAAVLSVTIAYPTHVATFLQRLLLAARHYPTATRVQRVLINRTQVLDPRLDGMTPHAYKSPQGQSLRFDVLCDGELPESGVLRISSGLVRGRSLELTRLSLDQRLARLRQAERRLSEMIDDAEAILRDAWRAEISGAIQLDAPSVADFVRQARLSRDAVEECRDRLSDAISEWPGPHAASAIYSGEMPRLVDAFQYKIYVGDAWTDPASVEMIPLPAVELRLEVTPPEYAREMEVSGSPAARQFAVLEGSRVDFSLAVLNHKQLEEAWIVVRQQPEPLRFPLLPHGENRKLWSLTDPESPFHDIREELRFDVQVRDVDNMTLERPLQGFLRLRTDRPPSGSQEVVHRVVLPRAKPKIEYRASDDFGIASLRLLIQVESAAAVSTGEAAVGAGAATEANAQNAQPSEETPTKIIELLNSDRGIVRGDDLPISDGQIVDLSEFNLAKGDRVKITLEVRDFRGSLPGVSTISDPLVLEISDENGVYAAILEADQKSEKQLSEIIQRELGIGETP